VEGRRLGQRQRRAPLSTHAVALFSWLGAFSWDNVAYAAGSSGAALAGQADVAYKASVFAAAA